jgi:hypothetical protein
LYADLVNRFIVPAVETRRSASAPTSDVKPGKIALADIWMNKTVIGPNTEVRMVPSTAPKERHKEFHD